jgi:hypothetical protein
LRAAWLGVFLFAFLFGRGWQWGKNVRDLGKDPGERYLRASSSVNEIKGVAANGPAGIADYFHEMRNPPPDATEPPVAGTHWTDVRLSVAQDWDDVVMAIPRMLHYWGNQQQHPRLPGRHDYYIVLMTLYEAPIVLAALGGVIYLSRRRTPFGDLLLWWAVTSYVLYALANEKVPWLLNHIMLPFCLIGGWWLSQLRPQSTLARNTMIGVAALSAVFLLRNISGTNFERAGKNREPMFYAQTTEEFAETLLGNLSKTTPEQGAIWVHGEKQWPAAWYLRDKAPMRGNSGVGYGSEPGLDPHRMLVTLEDDWLIKKAQPRWKNWEGKVVDHYIWPRASWPALRPDRFWRWWWTREALSEEEQKKPMDQWQNSILTPPGEWSHNTAVMAVERP